MKGEETSDGLLRSYYTVFRFPRGVNRLQARYFNKDGLRARNFIFLKRSGRGGNEKGTTGNRKSDWFRFQRRPFASTPDATADHRTGDCT